MIKYFFLIWNIRKEQNYQKIIRLSKLEFIQVKDPTKVRGAADVMNSRQL